MALLRTARRPGGGDNNTWPGFVDALSTLLLVIIFLLSIFMLAQFFLGQALSGRDAALDRLRTQVLELSDLLSLQRQANDDLRANVTQLSASLMDSNSSREEMQRRITSLEADIAQAQGITGRVAQSSNQQQETIGDLETRYNTAMTNLEKEKQLSARAQQEVELLNNQLIALRQQLSVLNAALEASELNDKEQEAVIANLSERLNTALASKVMELNQFRSDFFGKLRQALGDRSDIRIQGDRFIFQSEVLFPSASAVIGVSGREEMVKLADTLKTIMDTIPKDVNWILRIDGHTDILPIRTEQFPSNWDLSTARALSVVKLLINQGIPADRLAATGFGQFHPLDPADTADAYRRNRRIEMRLDQK
ncbi:MAG: peptidoglycan -binding protein [Proteobacteria bacterium]|jgi:chemotaxis protein MotB|nr:peptidoglycan -binding protein [Pseudomonadota bacterium]